VIAALLQMAEHQKLLLFGLWEMQIVQHCSSFPGKNNYLYVLNSFQATWVIFFTFPLETMKKIRILV
jgi:hypothetical protein